MLDSKVLQVFYDEKCYPFKDKERSVRFPIIGNSFVGASNVTEIRFYIDRIGSNEDSWVANSKLPNGKMGSKILQTFPDSEVGEYYAKLNLTSFYTQAKGDVYISLNGFYGGVSITQHNGVYQISGIPTIQATGSIKLSVYYATPLIDSDEISAVTLSQVLAEIATKMPKSSGKYLKVISSVSSINTSEYQDYLFSGDIVYAKTQKEFYLIGGTYPNLTTSVITLDISSLNVAILDVSDEINISDFSYIYDSNNKSLTAYIDETIENKQKTIFDMGSSSPKTLNDTEYALLSQNNNVRIKFNNNYFDKAITSSSNDTYICVIDSYVANNGATDRKVKAISLNHTLKRLDYGETTSITLYNKSQMDTLLGGKANVDDVYDKDTIDSKLTAMLVYKGTLTVDQINALDTSTLKTGWFYNVSDRGILTVGNIEVLQGDNICWTGSGWDKLTMDLSAYDDKFIAAGFFEVQDYNENTGEITFVYASDLYNMSYDTSTGVLTITAS